MKDVCGCCEGITAVTPVSIENRPGQDEITYRVGTHATFLETMEARLGQVTITPESPGAAPVRPLLKLRTREESDPAIAMLDAFAALGDVLTFYQERIANEGYLRTATERRSLVELGRLVGYAPRPGVASSTFLAFTMQEGGDYDGVIPAGTRAQTLPKPGQTPQPFETSEPLEARAAFNLIKPKRTRAQTLDTLLKSSTLYLNGTKLNLAVNDAILVERITPARKKGAPPTREFSLYRLLDVGADQATNRTTIKVTEWREASPPLQAHHEGEPSEPNNIPVEGEDNNPDKDPPRVERDWLEESIKRLMQPTPKDAVPPGDPLAAAPSLAASFGKGSDVLLRTLAGLRPELAPLLYAALKEASQPVEPTLRVYAMRVKAKLFGSNAPKKVLYEAVHLNNSQLTIPEPKDPDSWQEPSLVVVGEGIIPIDVKDLYLDNFYDKIKPSTAATPAYVAIEIKGGDPVTFPIKRVEAPVRSDYGLSQKTTKLTLELSERDDAWYPVKIESLEGQQHLAEPRDLGDLRDVVVYAQSEELPLDEIPCDKTISGNSIELDDLYEGLVPGRWLIVSGERADLPGIRASERVLIGSVEQIDQPGTRANRRRTVVNTVNSLAHSYLCDSVVIYGNVVHATHGETKSEVLGSGDASKPYQSFSLQQRPLTYVSADTPSGAASTLTVRVDGIRFTEVRDFYELGPQDRSYVTRAAEDGKVTVTFGDGRRGARPSTGLENIRAQYRVGIGAAGNADAEQITIPVTKPLGLKAVTNPIPATGGADPETLEQIRRNAALSLMALDRLVSVQDYADFAHAFAGVDKAFAARAVIKGADVVHVTIAAIDDGPVDPGSDLYQNLLSALHRYGDPQQDVRLSLRERTLLVIGAGVRVAPEVQWSDVEPKIRARLLDAFGFARRALWQNVTASEVIATIHRVPGVVSVTLDVFGGIPAKNDKGDDLLPADIEKAVGDLLDPKRRSDRALSGARDPSRPAPLVYLSPAIRETLNLRELST